MIQLECSNCKTLLSIDDAFAGGVCRCQHCGTIQTVPKPGKDAAVTASADSPKALFKRKARIESALNPYSDSLDRAADEMGSSGNLSANAIASIGPVSRSAGSEASSSSHAGTPTPAPRNGKPAASEAASTPTKPSPPPVQTPSYMPTPSKSAGKAPPPKSGLNPMLIVACAVGLVVVLAVVAWFALGNRNSASSSQKATVVPSPADAKPTIASPTPTPAPATDPAAVVVPVAVAPVAAPAPNVPTRSAAICGIPLAESSVVYLIDRAGCTQQAFQQITDACIRSAESLGTGKRFQIVVLNNFKDLAYPASALGASSNVEIDAARKAIADTAAGASDVNAVLSRIAALSPSAIVLVSATDLEPITADQFRTALKDKSIKLHAIAVGTDLTGQQLRTLTTEMGGQFKQLDLASLQ